MLFNSYEYIFLFLPIVCLIFYFLRQFEFYRAALAWLVFASLFFYGWWNPVYVPLLLATIFVNYGAGRYLMEDYPYRRIVLTLSIIGNLSLIGYFKYFDFFLENVNASFGTEYNLVHVILPLAISFFTFQQIAYLVDAYRKLVREKSLLHYALFVTFFPQLIAGPIVHHSEMMPQYDASLKRELQWSELAVGLSIYTMGLFKKVVIADGLAPVATSVFGAADSGSAIAFLTAWSGALAYTFQLYFDFSGYSDMAIGSALLFGIVLPVNFYSPYKAKNIIEFWRRWHITLSRFLRDYLYFPLGGNRKGKTRRYINLAITMLLGGLWHGAAWTFVIWGGLHGVYLVINHAVRKIARDMGGIAVPALIGGAITFLAVIVAWVFFRAETLPGAIVMLQAMFGANGFGADIEIPVNAATLSTSANVMGWSNLLTDGMKPDRFLILLGGAFVIATVFPNTAQFYLERNSRLRFKASPLNLLIIIACWVLVFVSLGGRSEFLYFQF